MPYHKILDGAEEKSLGDKKIGTTKKGIGPCYSDKIARKGIRAIDLIDKNVLSKRLDAIIPEKQRFFKLYNIGEKLDKNKILKTYVEYGKCLKDYIAPTKSGGSEPRRGEVLKGTEAQLRTKRFP